MKPIKKKFFDDRQAGFLAEGITAMLGPDFADLADQFGGIEWQKDLIRFMPVAERCKEARGKRYLSIKESASLLKVPQYRIKDIEGSRIRDIKLNILESYTDLLGIRRWFKKWIKSSADVYQRIQKSG